MLKEFKEFATKGNVMDMAIGVIIGASFQGIVTSLVNDIIMPTISIFTGKVDFTNLCINIGDTSIKYGMFLTKILDFLIIAFTIFLVIRYFNKLNKKMEQLTAKEIEKLNKKFKKNLKKKKQENIPEPTTKICPYCFSEINVKATKCPHCTSSIEVAKESTAFDEQIEISVEES